MKILFTADWHIKLGQKNVPIEWQLNRYRLLFLKIAELQKEVDLIVIGGDIFDKLPSLEELELYFEFIPMVSKSTIIYDGNHEATKKGYTFLSKLQKATKSINPFVDIVTDKISSEIFDILPYCKLKDFEKEKKWYNNSKILFTHVRGNIPPHVKAEVDLSIFKNWEIVLAGDLHSHENTQENIVYPGSPLSTTFHRSPITNGVIIFDTITMKYEFINIGLPQLIRKTITDMSQAIPTTYDHTIYEITGNILDLANVDTTAEHIDKKVIQKDTKKTLNLKNKTTVEELIEYLQTVQKLDTESIQSIVSVYHDYIREEEINDTI